jgi:hypothetical protein
VNIATPTGENSGPSIRIYSSAAAVRCNGSATRDRHRPRRSKCPSLAHALETVSNGTGHLAEALRIETRGLVTTIMQVSGTKFRPETYTVLRRNLGALPSSRHALRYNPLSTESSAMHNFTDHRYSKVLFAPDAVWHRLCQIYRVREAQRR